MAATKATTATNATKATTATNATKATTATNAAKAPAHVFEPARPDLPDPRAVALAWRLAEIAYASSRAEISPYPVLCVAIGSLRGAAVPENGICMPTRARDRLIALLDSARDAPAAGAPPSGAAGETDAAGLATDRAGTYLDPETCGVISREVAAAAECMRVFDDARPRLVALLARLLVTSPGRGADEIDGLAREAAAYVGGPRGGALLDAASALFPRRG